MSPPLSIPPANYLQQNTMTVPASPSTANARPQFRRQGSSYGPGHVHNMALIVKPVRMDYGVNKGGLRSWIVLLVFVLLCSALLTIFSEEPGTKQNARNKVDIDADEKDDPETSESHQTEVLETEVSAAADDNDDKIEDKIDEEEILLANLKEKATYNEKKRRKTKGKSPGESEPKMIVIESELENDEGEDNENKESENDEITPKIVHGVKADSEYRQEKCGKKKCGRRKDEKEEEKQNENVDVERGKLVEENVGEEAEDDDDEEEEEDEPIYRKTKSRVGQKRAKSWHESVQVENSRKPRKNILKHKKVQRNLELDNVDEVDDGDKEIEENTVNDVGQTHDVITVKKRSGTYNRKAITNRDDYKQRMQIDSADFQTEKHNFDSALKAYDQILRANPQSPRAHFGRGRLFQLKAEFDGRDRTKELLEQAMAEYMTVVEDDDTPNELFRMAAENFVECARFHGGNPHKIVTVQRALIDKFPDELRYQIDFGITFLAMSRPDDAHNVFKNILETDPNNGLALAYYGYLLKVYHDDLEKGVLNIRRGLRHSEEAANDAKFYFHLGDGLTRLGRNQEAYKVYEEGAARGLFPSVYQRSVHNLEGLVARPWWTLEQTECAKHLRYVERHWTVIKEEVLRLWNKHQSKFEEDEDRKYCETGIPKAFYLRKNGEFLQKACKLLPTTCEILEKIASEPTTCIKGNIRISVLTAGTIIWPHCQPMNYILEAQLGLVTSGEARIRVGAETRGWKQGKFIVYDTSFETEVTFDGASSNAVRIVLALEIWHPGVPQPLRKSVEERKSD